MHSLQKLGLLVAPAFLLAGCFGTAGVNDSVAGARLPTGVTLLESNREECSGTVHVDDESRREVVVNQGSTATFEADGDEEIEWTCVGERAADADNVECPDDTSHVRVSRPASGDDLLFECFGRE